MPADQKSFTDLIDIAARRRRLLVGLPIAVAVTAVLVSLVLPERYTAESRFMPETKRSQLSQMAGLAAQFGIELGSAESGESIDFYAELLESTDLLRAAALSEYAFETKRGEPMRGTLVELLDAKGDTEPERIKDAVERLEKLVGVTPDAAAKLVTVKASAPWSELAVALNARLLELVGEFNLERRQTRAAVEREFLQGRLAAAEQDLRAAEERLERFLVQNRAWEESPQLRFEQARLQRRIDVLQQVYASVAEGLEQARMDEVRNTPIITVIDQPRAPAEKTFPNLILNGALGLVLGALLAVGIIAVGEMRRPAGAKPYPRPVQTVEPEWETAAR